MESFKNEITIMRSMGIRASVIKMGIYVRILFTLIPAYAFLIAIAVAMHISPFINYLFTYLYAWQYLLLAIGLLLLSAQVTRSQIKKLFHESVKKSLKGGGVA